MPSSRNLKPLRQGHLDGFCGLYAVINALRLMGTGWYRMSHAECQALLLMMLGELNRKGGLHGIAIDGLTPKQLRSMLRIAAKWLQERKLCRLEFHRPWNAKSQVPGSMSTALDIIEGHIGHAHGAAIIGIAGGYDHWSILECIADNKLRLFDSSRCWSPNLKDVDVLPVNRSGKKYQLVPGDVCLLTVSQQFTPSEGTAPTC